MSRICLLVFALLQFATSQNCNSNLNRASECSALYKQFETALLSDENLFKLRRVFFPSSKADPIVVDVKYHVNINTTETCSETNQAGENKPENGSSVSLTRDLVWTSSVTFSLLDSHVLDLLQPRIVLLLDPIKGSYYREVTDDIELSLQITSSSCPPSTTEIVSTLEDLNAMVSHYQFKMHACNGV